MPGSFMMSFSSGTVTVAYVPDQVGRYTISVKYGGDEIPYSPYRIRTVPSGDASKCLVSGVYSAGIFFS